MRTTPFLFFFLFLTASVFVRAEHIDSYDFPALSAEEATLYSACWASEDKGEKLKVRVWEDTSKFSVRYFRSPSPLAETVIVLGGLGSDETAHTSLFLARFFAEKGYSVLVVPNTFTPDFLLGASSSRVVGDTPSDAKDLYEALLRVKEAAAGVGLNMESPYLVGYSHGGLLASALARVDESRQEIRFRSALLINPAADLLHGLKTLDSLAAKFEEISFKRLLFFLFKLKGRMKDCSRLPLTQHEPLNFMKNLGLRKDEAASLIGMAFSVTLRKLVAATENLNRFGILPPLEPPSSAAHRASRRRRSQAAADFTYQMYVEKVLTVYHPRLKHGMSLDQINGETGLFTMHSRTARAPVFVIHNADDFILQPGDIKQIREVFGSRALIFPRGGHMGNLGHYQTLAAIENWLKKGHF